MSQAGPATGWMRPAGMLRLALGLCVLYGASASQPSPAMGEEKLRTLSGKFLFKGEPPKLPLLVVKGDPSIKDADVCGAADIPSEELKVGPAGELSNVFIYLGRPPQGYKALPVPETPVVIRQVGCVFVPHASVVRVGQAIRMRNSDRIAHITHPTPIRGAGFSGAIAPRDGNDEALTYTAAERAPVPVYCNIHRWMKAYQLPLDHPFGAVSDAKGMFTIAGLPAGKYEFVIWHEMKGYVNRNYAVDLVTADRALTIEYQLSDLKNAD